MVMQGYKQTEIGMVPVKWSVSDFGSKVKIYRGGSPRPIQDYLTQAQDGINWIKIGDVREGDKYITSTEEKIIPAGVAQSRTVHAGDFILSNSMSFGRPYILNIDGCIHDGWLTIQKYEKTFSKNFLYYLLSSDSVYQQYISMAAGSSVKNLNKEKVSALVVAYPDIKEQERIADALSNIDFLIATLEKQIAKKKAIKQGTMQELLTGKRRLPGFSGEWETRTLHEISNEMVDGPFGSNLKTEHYTTERQVRIIQLSNIGEAGWNNANVKYTTFSHAAELQRCIVQPGSILIAKMMPAGRAIICPDNEKSYILGSDVVKVVPNSSVDSRYLVYATKSQFYLDQIADDTQGSTRARTSVSKLRKTAILFPEKDEQIAIADILSEMDMEIAALEGKIAKYRQIKQGMMQQLLTGKIRLV